MIGFLAFALPLALFLRFPSTFWNFDGVACAAALELGQSAYFFHANHLLYGFVGFLFWKGVASPLGITRALPALQLFTSLLSAAGLIGLYRLLDALLNHPWIALLLTTSLAITAAFWVWSVEAQVYTLGFLALAWATVVLLEGQGRFHYLWVGLLHGTAVLGHVLHLLWIIPALYWMRKKNQWSRPALLRYLSSLTAMILLPYTLVLKWIIAPGRDLNHILIWLKGSAGLTPDRRFAWHSAGWTGSWIWLKSTLPSLWGSFWPYSKTAVPTVIWVLTGYSMLVIAALVLRGLCSKETPACFAALWLIVYGLFLSTWEPATLCYRMTDILPLGLLLALGLKGWKPLWQTLVVTTLLASLLTVNLTMRIRPMGDASQNPTYQEALTLSKITSEKSLYVTEGGQTWMYMLYFTGRTAWNAHAFAPASLREELLMQRKTRPVYIQSSLLQDSEDSAWLRTQKLKPTEEGSSWLQML